MALDGFVVSALANELSHALVGGRITKISQPEADELILTIKNYDNFRLRISANASLPLCLLTNSNKPAPLTAPGFCMLLRKHLNSARILEITQPDLERVLMIKIEHLDEMSDRQIKWLIVELMGKCSNIIFCDEEMKIVDSIKHVSSFVSSIREVLPGRTYFIPQTTEKFSPLNADDTAFDAMFAKPCELSKAIYTTFTGFSPLMANELLYRSSLDANRPGCALTKPEQEVLKQNFQTLLALVKEGHFSPCILKKNLEPVEFSCFSLHVYHDFPEYSEHSYESISETLEQFYGERDTLLRMKQRSADLRKVVASAIERTVKKLDLQEKQQKDTEKREQYRIYGELLTTYGYSCDNGAKSFTCINYYTNDNITIPLDDTQPVMANAKRYFDKYTKLKRTNEQLLIHIADTKAELAHLDSIRESLTYAETEADLSAIKKELTDFGYLKFHKDMTNIGKKKPKVSKSLPYHYKTIDGLDIFVGKNNYQNDELTFHLANGGDWWFHAKGIPGSHVILRTNGTEPDPKAFEAAASLAAYYSQNRESDKVEIDYSERKNIKKPNGAKPGFVVYYTNYSMMAKPSLEGVTQE